MKNINKNTKKILITVITSAVVACLSSGSSFALTQVGSMSELSNAFSSGETEIEISSDFDFDAKLTLPENATITIDGKDKTLTRAASFGDNFLSIPATTQLTIKNLHLDGGAANWYPDLDNWYLRYNSDKSRSYGLYYTIYDENDVTAQQSIIYNAGTLKLNDSSIKNSHAVQTSAAIRSLGSLYITNSEISRNTVENVNGGAITISGAESIFSIDNSVISNNNCGPGTTASKSAGAIYVDNIKEVTIKNSTFEYNTATNDGGVMKITTATSALLENNIFRYNTNGNDGSAIRVGDGQSTEGRKITLKDNIFDNNKSLVYDDPVGNGEGAFSMFNGGFDDIEITGGEFTNNKASFGTAISIYGEGNKTYNKVHISDVLIKDNYAKNGANHILGVRTGTNEVELDNVEFVNNAGYIYITLTENVSIKNSTVSNNTGCTNGAIRLFDNQNLLISDTAVSGNEGIGKAGAGIFIRSDSSDDQYAKLERVTSSYNKNGTYGTGVAIFANSELFTVDIVDSTIIGNESTSDGAGIMLKRSNDNTVGRGAVTISGSTVIKDNHANGLGGGIAVDPRSAYQVTVEAGVQLYHNSADEGGDDIYYPAQDDGHSDFEFFSLAKATSQGVAGIEGWYEDGPDARYSENNSIEVIRLDMLSPDAYYLKAVYEEPPVNPQTGDQTTTMVIIGLIALVGAFGLRKAAAKRR